MHAGFIETNKSCKSFLEKLLKDLRENILVSSRQIPEKVYIKNLQNFQCM